MTSQTKIIRPGQPSPRAFATSYIASNALAMSGVRFRAYLLGTLLGLPLPIAVYCLFFDSLAQTLNLK